MTQFDYAKQQQERSEGRGVKLSALEGIFLQAKLRGFKNPKLRTPLLTFSAATEKSKTPAAIWVHDNKDGEYLGKVLNGSWFGPMKFMKLVNDTIAAPKEAAVKYGHLTGECSICGRKLDNAISVYNGIGPICAEKLGIHLAEPPKDIDTLDLINTL